MKINPNNPFQESEILDGLEAMHRRGDPGYAEAYNWYMQTYQPPVESDYYEGYQGQPQKPTYTDLYNQGQADRGWEAYIPTVQNLWEGAKSSGLAEWGRGWFEKAVPPTLEERQARPYIVEEPGLPRPDFGPTTQEWLSKGLQATIDHGDGTIHQEDIGGLAQRRFEAQFPSAPGGVGDPSGFDRQMAVEADTRRAKREATLGPIRDWIEGGGGIGSLAALTGTEAGETGRVEDDFLFSLFPTKEEKEAFVHLTSKERQQPSIVPGYTRGDLTDLGYSLELMGPALATMLTTKNPAAALAMFAPPVFGKTYGEHLKGGKSEEESLELAKKAVIFEVVPELLLWGPFKLIKKPAMAILASIPAEAASEVITELGYIQDEIRNQGKTITPAEMIARLQHAAKMGAIMGPALGASFSLPHMYNAIAKGKPEQVVRILQKQREKMVAAGEPAVKIEIIDGAIETFNDHTLSPEEHARALRRLASPDALGGIFEAYGARTRRSWRAGPGRDAVTDPGFVETEETVPGFSDWEMVGAGRPERAGAAIFSPTVVIEQLTLENGGRAPSRAQVKQRTIELINEEVGQHGGLRAAIIALGFSSEDQKNFYARILQENKAEIEAWEQGEGRVYARKGRDGKLYHDKNESVDEWLAYLNRQRQRGLAVNKAPLGKYIRHIIRTFKKETELNLTVAEATEIVDKLHSRLGERGADLATPRVEEAPPVTETLDTSKADLDAARAGRRLEETILDEQTASLERSTFGDTRFAKGDPIDPSRRRFMQQVGGATAGAALDPRILLEPATAPAVEAPMYTGMTPQFPGSVYEFSIAVDPDAGWTSSDDPSEGAIDVAFTHDPNTNEVTVYEGDEVVDEFIVDDMHADAEVLEYVRDKYGRVNINDARVQREEMDRDLATGEGGFDYWGDADQNFDNMARNIIRGEKTMAGVEKIERGPAYDYFDEPTTPRTQEALPEPAQEALPAPKETAEKTDAELYVETIDEIMSIYDADSPASEAAADGSLNDRIISYAAETPFTREELWEGVNQRIEALEDTGTRFAKRAADMTEAEKLNRNIRNDFAKGPYKEIVGREDEADIRARIKRLGNLFGPMGQKRGIEPGDRATAKEQAQNAIDNVEAFEKFMAPFEVQMQEQPARSRTVAGRREKYAERKGITVAEILSYRDRGKIHPMEKKMSYTFGIEEIDRLEGEGEITANEAETRRRTLNDLRNQLGGKMPPGAKRKATEIVYGIGDYANIEAWGYTKAETAGMEERAEVARGQERVRGLRRTEKTEKELEEITGSDVTPTEMLQIASLREMDAFDLKTDEARLRWIREKEAMPASERAELDAFMRNIRGWDEAAFKKQRDYEERESHLDMIVDQDQFRIEQTPAQRKAELKAMKEAQAPIEKRKHVQVEPDFFDTLVDTNFTVQGESVPEGFMELTEEGEVAEATDSDTRYAKRDAERNAKLINKGGVAVIINDMDSIFDDALEQELSYDKLVDKMIAWERERIGPSGKLDPEATWNRQMYIRNNDELRAYAAAKRGEYQELLEEEKVDSSRETMPKKVKNMLKKHDLFKQDKFWNNRGNSRKNVFAIPQYSRILYRFLNGESAGTDIDRAVQERLSPQGKDKSFMSNARTSLNNEGENPLVVDHVMELVTPGQRKKVTTIIPFPDTKGTFGRDVTADLLLVTKPLHDMKTAFVNKTKYGGSEERQDRYDSYTAMLDFMQTDTLEARLFNKKYADKFGITEEQLIAKVKKYLETTKGEGALFAKILKAHNEWHGTAASEAAEKVAAELDSALIKKPALLKEFESTITRYAKRAKGESYEEHFNKNFWYTLTSYLWGKPVQAIRDFNKISRFGQRKADVPAADEIADEVQRAHSSTQRAEPLVYGTDIVQDTSIKTGQFYTRLAQIFSRVTARLGDIETRENQMLVDILTGKIRIEELDNAEHREAAKLLRELMQDVYNYAKTETKGLKDPLDLRGHGDTLLPRVWNIEFLATRRGKAKFLKAIRAAVSDPATGSSILEDADLTVEDLYNVVVNSGGFVQGDWTNLKADQTRSQKEIDRDIKAQEYLDALPTESLIDEDLVMIDLQAIIPRFIQKAVERTEYSKRFGVNDEILRAKIKEGLEQIKIHNAKVLKLDKTDKSLTYIDPRAFEKSVWDMARILRNKYGYDMANMQTRAWLQRVVNFEVIAKLPLVTLASMPELFTPMLRGDVRADKWVVDFMAGLAWAGYKGMNGISKLLLNKHLPAMRKASSEIGGIGVVSDVQLLRELGIAEIQAMGDAVSTRYANPNFARGGLRAGARTTIAGRIPKKVRAVFNMQTYMQATLLTTLTEMQQLMALRNFQRHMAKRVKFVQKNAGKDLKGRRLRLFKQFSKDMADFGLPENIDLSTPAGEAEFNAGAIRFVDQVITRPNDATTSKAFKNPLTAPIFLFKRFLTVFGNTLMTAVGNDIATKVDNVEKAKQVGRILGAMTAMYGAVMFAEIMRAAIKGDLDEDDMTITGGDFRTFVRRVDRTGLLSAPGAMLLNLSFPYKRGWWDSPEARIWGELGGPIGGDVSALMKTGFDRRPGSAQRLIRQMVPMSKRLVDLPPKKKKRSSIESKW